MAAKPGGKTVPKKNPDTLSQLSDLAREMFSLDSQIEKAEEAVKKLRERRDLLATNLIPSIMDTLFMDEVPLKNGYKLSVGDTMFVSTTGDKREAINKWLSSTGNEGLLRHEIGISIGVGKEDKARLTRLIKFLNTKRKSTGSIDYSDKVAVNAQTFKALIREMMAEGKDVPLDELGVYVQRTAKLIKPKQR